MTVTRHDLVYRAAYRVVAAPAGEYLTVGDVYLCDGVPCGDDPRVTFGLHRAGDGSGTYLSATLLDRWLVVLERE